VKDELNERIIKKTERSEGLNRKIIYNNGAERSGAEDLNEMSEAKEVVLNKERTK